MPTKIAAKIVVTHAVVGSHKKVHRWFARNGIKPDALLVGEVITDEDGARRVDRYVGFAGTPLPADSDFDDVIHV